MAINTTGLRSNRFRCIRVYAQVYGVALLERYALSGSQMCIVTGPRIDLAIALIDRMKKLFSSGKGLITFDTKETAINLKWCKDRSISTTSFRCNAWFTKCIFHIIR